MAVLRCMLIACLLAVAGCAQWLPSWLGGDPGRGAHERTPDSRESNSAGFEGVSPPKSAASSPDAVSIVALQFDILRIDLPSSGTGDTAKIWNHVDEMRVDPRQAPLLVRNAMRLGSAGSSSWPALRAIFKAARATVTEQQQLVRGGEPLLIDLGVLDGEKTLFSYDRGGRLSGKTTAGGEMLMKLSYTTYPQVGGRTELIASFQVRRDRGVIEWENRGGQIVQAPSYDVVAFDDLTTMIGLGEGESLIVGPSEEAANAFLPGSHLFTVMRRGVRYDSVWIITPRPWETRSGSPRSP